MNPVIKWSLFLIVSVAVVQLAVAALGLNENPMVSGLVVIVLFIGLNIAAVILALKGTAAESGYGKQLLNGAILGVVAGVGIMIFSYVMLTFIFPHYLQETRDATVAWMEGAGMPEAQLEAQIAKLDQMTPMSQAVQGTIGTFITSVIVAAIAGIWLRRK